MKKVTTLGQMTAKVLLGLAFALVIFGGGADNAEAGTQSFTIVRPCGIPCILATNIYMTFNYPSTVVEGSNMTVTAYIGSDDYPQSFCPITRYSFGGLGGPFSTDYFPNCYDAATYTSGFTESHTLTAPSAGSYTFCITAGNSGYLGQPPKCGTLTVTPPPVAPTLVVSASPNRLKSSDNLTVAYNILSGSPDTIEYRITGPTTFPAPNPRSSPDVVGPAVATPSQFFGTTGAISDGTYTISMRACQGTLCGTTWSTATFTIFSDPPPSVNVQFKSR